MTLLAQRTADKQTCMSRGMKKIAAADEGTMSDLPSELDVDVGVIHASPCMHLDFLAG